MYLFFSENKKEDSSTRHSVSLTLDLKDQEDGEEQNRGDETRDTSKLRKKVHTLHVFIFRSRDENDGKRDIYVAK